MISPNKKTDAELAAPHFQHPQPQSESKPAYGQVFTDTPNTDLLMQSLEDLTRRIETLEQKRVNFNTDLIGLFETVLVAPTGIPANPYDQIKLANLSGTYYLYAYNTSSKTWKRVVIA